MKQNIYSSHLFTYSLLKKNLGNNSYIKESGNQYNVQQVKANKVYLDGKPDPTLQRRQEIETSQTLQTLSNVVVTQEITLKEVWEEFIEYKLKSGEICETTYITRFKRTFTNFLMPFFDRQLNDELATDILLLINTKKSNMSNMRKMLGSLSQACERLKKQGKLARNYFEDTQKSIKVPRKCQHTRYEEDRRAFTQVERDKIISAFYSSTIASEKRAGALVEFLFLTGCRLGEAFALKWKDIHEDFIVFDESYSTETKITKSTKTNTVRRFRRKGLNKLNNLLERIKPDNPSPDEYVFTTVTGKQYNRLKLSSVWLGIDKSKNKVPYYYSGIVSKLVKSGEIKEYLKPSSTRHTFITIQVRNGADLTLLAESCGNGLDIIYQHYLEKYTDDTQLVDV